MNEKVFLFLVFVVIAGAAQVVVDNNSTIEVELNTGDINITSADSAAQVSNDIGVGQVVNPVVTLIATPVQVLSGGDVTIQWSVVNSPTSCTFTGDWPGGGGVLAPVNFPPTSFVVYNVVSEFTLSVVCDNQAAGDSGIKSVTVAVGSGTVCTGLAAPILGGAEDRTVIANGTPVGGTYDGTYSQLVGAAGGQFIAFPGIYGNSFKFSLTKNQYISASFDSGQPNALGAFSFTTPGNFAGPGATALTVTISECPGDFNVHLGQSKCKGGGVNGTFKWSDLSSADPNQYCILEQNKQYYINFVHALDGGNNYATSGCGSSYCGQIVVPQKLN